MSSNYSYTDTGKVWNRIRKVKVNKSNNLPLLNSFCDTLEDKTKALDKHFELYQAALKQYKIRDKNKSSQDFYNGPFSLHELKIALATYKISAPGADDTHTQ